MNYDRSNLLYDYNTGWAFSSIKAYEEWHLKKLKETKQHALEEYKKMGRLNWYTQVQLLQLIKPQRLGPMPVFNYHYEEDE